MDSSEWIMIVMDKFDAALKSSQTGDKWRTRHQSWAWVSQWKLPALQLPTVRAPYRILFAEWLIIVCV